jgi:hypothetical protein
MPASCRSKEGILPSADGNLVLPMGVPVTNRLCGTRVFSTRQRVPLAARRVVTIDKALGAMEIHLGFGNTKQAYRAKW